MVTAIALLGVTFGSLVALLVETAKRKGLLAGILFLQAVYMLLGYVARPIILLTVQPAPRTGDPIADYRLFDGSYVSGVADSLIPISLAVVGYVILSFWLLRRFSTERSDSKFGLKRDSCIALIAIGWVFRGAYLVAPSNFVLAFAALSAAGVMLLLVLHGHTLGMLGTMSVLASEAVWAFASASKAPVLAVLAAAFLGFMLRKGRFSLRGSVVLVSSFCGLFLIFNEVKVRSGLLSSQDLWVSYYPLWCRWAMPVIARFDLYRAVVDGKVFVGKWLADGRLTEVLISQFLPRQLSGDDLEFSILWAREVRAFSLPDPGNGVRLATGPIAEGLALGGFWAVAVELSLVALTTVVCGTLLVGSSRFAAIFSASLLSHPYLFEQGVLGIGGGIGRGVILSAVGSVIVLCFDSNRRGSLFGAGSQARARS